VPGGVGPMTIAMLMHNTVALCSARRPGGVPASPHWRRGHSAVALVGTGGTQAVRPAIHGQLRW